jgi:hypothetical protein
MAGPKLAQPFAASIQRVLLARIARPGGVFDPKVRFGGPAGSLDPRAKGRSGQIGSPEPTMKEGAAPFGQERLLSRRKRTDRS